MCHYFQPTAEYTALPLHYSWYRHLSFILWSMLFCSTCSTISLWPLNNALSMTDSSNLSWECWVFLTYQTAMIFLTICCCVMSFVVTSANSCHIFLSDTGQLSFIELPWMSNSLYLLWQYCYMLWRMCLLVLDLFWAYTQIVKSYCWDGAGTWGECQWMLGDPRATFIGRKACD